MRGRPTTLAHVTAEQPHPDQPASTEPPAVATEDRRAQVQALVEQEGFARVTDLSAAFGVSTVTVRTDLQALEAAGTLRRVRGGAIPVDTSSLRERPFEVTQVEAAPQKARIAATAAALVEPGMSVLLDVGTTTAAVARELVRREDLHDVTVITNGISIALALEAAIPRLQVVVTGGTLRPLQHSLVAPLGGLLISHVHADLALIGCNGVDAEAGVTNVNLPEAEIKRAMVAAASRAVVLADGSKVGKARLGWVAAASEVDQLVTDSTAPDGALDALREVPGLTVTVA